MLDPNINVENYINWLFSITDTIQYKNDLQNRIDHIVFYFYLSSSRKIHHNKDENPQKIEYWKQEESRLREELEDITEQIIYELNYKKVIQRVTNDTEYTFIPSLDDREHLSIYKDNFYKEYLKDLKKALLFPTVSKDHTIKHRLESLSYNFLDIYTNPDKKLITSIEYPAKPFHTPKSELWETYIIINLAQDLATYEFLNHLIKLKENKKIEVYKQDQPINKDFLTYEEYEVRFNSVLSMLGYWDINRRKFTHKKITPTTIRNIIDALECVYIIKETTDNYKETERYRDVLRYLNLEYLGMYDRHKNRKESKPTIRMKEQIIEMAYTLYPDILP